ncbi:uncharacterized protein LOC127690653 [Apodemus sylvaticus]|uniref:uncharacterized protein LOC127690653 n=1 Tax=Apodemus sylvaticus TaxID=10129 RepID=UPI0022431C28|nr:uncharacterized protein LOC127690653 [Apodemus sylvaticus]
MFSRLRRLFRMENRDQGDTGPSQKESSKLSHRTGRMNSFWRRHRSAKKTSPQNSSITNQNKQNNKLEALNFDIRKMRFEKEELCRIMDLYNYNNLNYRMNVEFDIIKSQHEKARMDMEKMKQSISDAIEKYKEVIEDKYSYSTRHYHVLNACSQQKENVRILLHENNKLLVEQAEPQAYFGEEKRFCEEASKTIDFPCAKQQQV